MAQMRRAEAASRGLLAQAASACGCGRLMAPPAASSTPRRAMARNTSSRLARPKRLISSAGVSSAMMRPFSSMMTRSASRSTSAMLCEASTMVAARVAAVGLELGAHPVGRVGIERGGRLVEQQQLGLVEQRLGEADARLLAGRELAVGPVEQLGEPEVGGDLGDAPLEVAHAVEPGEHLEVLAHGQAHRHVDVGALEVHAVQHLVALARHVGAEHARLARRSAPPAPSASRWWWSCRRRCRRAAP